MSNAVLSEEKADQSMFKFNRAAFNQAGQPLVLVCPAGYELFKRRCSAYSENKTRCFVLILGWPTGMRNVKYKSPLLDHSL